MENVNEGESGSPIVNGSSDEHEEASSSTFRRGRCKRKHYHRHTPQQIQQLEGFFKDCPHPDENQRQQLSRELGLETKQIKFWFQNKRTQMKAQNERADNNLLRQENERMHCENLAMAEALKIVTCSNCSKVGAQGKEESLGQLQKLKRENEELKEKYARVRNFLANVSCDTNPRQNEQVLRSFPGVNMAENVNADENRNLPHNPLGNGLEEIEKTMIETAAKAMEEVLDLLRTNEPVWMRCPSDPERFIIHRQSYNKLFPKANHFKSSSSQFESSKDSVEVTMNATDLVKLFMHPTDWVDLFPTIVTKAKTLNILDSQDLAGSLHVMYKQMHIFSPLVAPREFVFLRYCIKFDSSSWVIVDVSHDYCRQMNEARPTRCWKLPSGCMIQNLPNGNSKVTWVEHVEVDDKTQTHRLFRGLVCTPQSYGAKIWLATLQRTCQRFSQSSGLTPLHQHKLEGVINIPEGRISTMKLANTMVKNFCEMLTMLDEVDFPLGEMNNTGLRVSVRPGGNEPGKPQDGMIISGATSFWLPLPCPSLFAFFKDEHMRPQWDVLLNGNRVNGVGHISCGYHPGNGISVLRPFMPNQKEAMLILQESGIDASGAFVIYSPIGLQTFTMAMTGQDTSKISLQPSGITISSSDDSRFHNCSTSKSPQPQHDSLVTVALQVHILGETLTNQYSFGSESVATITTLIASTVHSIKAAFDLSDLD